jgi:hypothetical protein
MLVRSSERLMREAAKLAEHPSPAGLSPARQPPIHPDRRSPEREERQRLSRRHLVETSTLLRSLAREMCLQAQEARWRSAQARTVSVALRAARQTPA